MIFWICVLIASNFFIKLVVNGLNLSYMGRPIPKEFAAIWDEEKYRRSQEYLKENTLFDLFTSGLTSGLLILFLAGGFLPLTDKFVRSFGFGEVVTGVLFFALLILALLILSLPFSAYRTFVIEEKFGFNRTTPLTFFKDFFMETILALAIYSLIIGSLLFLFNLYGPSAWIFCFAFFAAFTLFLYYISPNWIMPLFNRLTPLPDGPLKEAVQRYLSSQKFAMEDVFSIDGSKRSNKANAFFTGLGKTKRVALFDTLIANYSIGEIIAILAHEVGHYKKHHLEIGLAAALLGNGILFFLFSLFAPHAPSYYIAMLLFIIAFGSVSWIPTLLQMALSRKHEYEADAFAKETADGKEMVSALLKLSSDNLTNLTPHPIKVLFSYSHPPVLDRIKAISDKKNI